MGRKASLLKTIETCCAESCWWGNTGFADGVGPESDDRHDAGIHRRYQFDHMLVECITVAVSQDTVLPERIDHLNRADGSTIASVALAGALQVKDRKIVR